MKTINLRNFYAWYTHDEFVKIPTKVAAELIADKRYQRTHERNIRRYRVLSLDMDDNTESSAIASYNDSPERIIDLMERHCRLCRALNSLPEVQARRIEAHFILGMSQRNIAKSEGVNERNIRHSIRKGIAGMKRFLKNP
ncbi:sigma-70 family RNA polymerase sigma factor [Christensenellaceae bacterium OttesenSCG-928-K19]|nr:sigma-70 family RNA polymerase sigma factor [Christensenellaceae bacterium OttesenSCG-928-K19]